jgi:hypothetical protein
MTQQQRGLFPETAAVIGASGDRDLLDYADCQLPTANCQLFSHSPLTC